MDFEVFWCKIKLRVCLLCFFSFQHTFVETKATKTFSEVKSCVFLLVFLSAPPLPPPMLEIHDAIDTDMENIEICNIEFSDALICF